MPPKRDAARIKAKAEELRRFASVAEREQDRVHLTAMAEKLARLADGEGIENDPPTATR